MNPPSLNILLTGAGSGLGRGLAKCLAERGHYLFLADLNADGLRETLKLIGESRGETHTLDVTSSAQIAGVMKAVGSKRIDALINNAGLQHVSPTAEFPEER